VTIRAHFRLPFDQGRGRGQKRVASRRPEVPRKFCAETNEPYLPAGGKAGKEPSEASAEAGKHAFADGSHPGATEACFLLRGPNGRGVRIGAVWWSEQSEEDTMRVAVAVVLVASVLTCSVAPVETSR
jgi:hypothetical protein